MHRFYGICEISRPIQLLGYIYLGHANLNKFQNVVIVVQYFVPMFLVLR